MTIIFGTKRLGKEDGANGTYQKYPDTAVVTLEGVRGHGKSRRFLFNKKAMESFNLNNGDVQQLVFGTLTNGEEKFVLLANANDIQDLDGATVYKTSKNAVAFDDSKEKGKAVSSSVITGDIANFLGLDGTQNNEFTLEDLNNENIEAMKLVPMNVNNMEVVAPETVENTVDDTFVNEAPEAPAVDANWEENINDAQPSQVNEGLTRVNAAE